MLRIEQHPQFRLETYSPIVGPTDDTCHPGEGVVVGVNVEAEEDLGAGTVGPTDEEEYGWWWRVVRVCCGL